MSQHRLFLVLHIPPFSIPSVLGLLLLLKSQSGAASLVHTGLFDLSLKNESRELRKCEECFTSPHYVSGDIPALCAGSGVKESVLFVRAFENKREAGSRNICVYLV